MILIPRASTSTGEAAATEDRGGGDRSWNAVIAIRSGARARAPTAKRIEQFDPALEKIVSTTEPIKDIAFGFGGPLGSAEGPVWIREGGYSCSATSMPASG